MIAQNNLQDLGEVGRGASVGVYVDVVKPGGGAKTIRPAA
jgi:hypothetical protein